MSTPLVSVAMVTRNVERFLPEAIESILNQTFNDLEFVIVDFGSTDSSKSIVAAYQLKDARIKFHEIPTCTLSEARNASCFLAAGRYVAIMDADDIAVTDRLASQIEFMDQHPEVGLVGGATEWIDETGKVLRNQFYPSGDSEIREALLSNSPFCNPTVLIKRDVFAATGGFRKLAPAEDYDLFLRISERCEMANLPRVVLRYRIHPHQESQRNVKQMTLSVLAAQVSAEIRTSGKRDPLDSVEEITPEVLDGLGVDKRKQQTTLARHYLTWIRFMSKARQTSAALEQVRRVLRSEDLSAAEKWVVADIRLAAARLYWRQGKFFQSLVYAFQAVLTRPLILARPLKRLMRLSRPRLKRLPVAHPGVGPQ